METTVLICDCEGSVETDREALCKLCDTGKMHTSLCRKELGVVADALAAGDTLVACAQEGRRFENLADELGVDTLATVDLRDRALWSEEGADAAPKVAALLAERTRFGRAAGSIDLQSEGVCLVYGPGEVAMRAAETLAETLTVTLMLSDVGDAIPRWSMPCDVLKGRLRRVTGHFGAFEILADAVAEAIPGGRGDFRFGQARDGGRSQCDLIVDLSGGASLVPAPNKRDGYLRAEPGDAAAIAEALRQASLLVGTFEKPLYIDFHAELCAHSRSGQPGCTRCLDVCPTGAIIPDGETVRIDPLVCAGCGGCSAVCPSGAAEYALPRPGDARMRLEAMLTAYGEAGGEAPRVLIHDEREGRPLIGMAARFGRGLPADVIPFAVNEMPQVSHDLILGALAMGAREVFVHLPERLRREGEADALDFQARLVAAFGEGTGFGERLCIVETDDPDALCEALYSEGPPPLEVEPISPVGDKRAATRLSVGTLARDETPFPLPEGAPYGDVVMDTEACTLCLACISQCPVGALVDNPNKPQVGFREDACLQCGICVSTCPENALKLAPRYNPAPAARSVRVLKEEEPFRCVECGKPFGSRGSVERILEKLGGKHWMFENPDRAKVIQMCSDCRVGAVFEISDNPFNMGERPRVRTTDDYLPGKDGKRKFDA